MFSEGLSEAENFWLWLHRDHEEEGYQVIKTEMTRESYYNLNVIRMELVRKIFSENVLKIKISEVHQNASEDQSDKKYPDVKSFYEIPIGFTPVHGVL